MKYKVLLDVLVDKGELSSDFLDVQRQSEAPDKADVVLIWIISLHQSNHEARASWFEFFMKN